ncbi:MAG TPA: peptidoglycan-binding protein [Candidatus Nitrosotenuis sp.]|nr:peptidoglycan-binding protein [Candidatus Nitrosotenuis sp.]
MSLSAESRQGATRGTNPVNFAAWGQGQSPHLSLDQGQRLRRGSRGQDVRTTQELLRRHGADIEADGVFGPKTQKAVREFQEKHGLAVDGIVGPQTQQALNNVGQQGRVQPPGEAPAASPVAGSGRFAHTRQALDRLPEPLRKYADAFQRAGEKYGVDPRFLAAISMHETGGGTSAAFRNKNNAMGVTGKRSTRRFESVEASIDYMARRLADPAGYYRKHNTISGIGSVYAPHGAANDPRNLNRYWVGGVSANYRRLGGDPSGPVVFR